ncbi:hypothetical protein PTKIN_Ptkin11bG0029800 [Pterospermum kingtungense]
MIGGYASHGFATEALELFELMKRKKVQPTYITFISVLIACAHAGLVDEGRAYFKAMVSEYGIEPTIEHYASLVDNANRHGLLEEAMDLVRSIPFEPDKAVWVQYQLAHVTAEALMRLEPESSAPYILLYNMYADAGQWDDAAEVREMMERNDIKKQAAMGHQQFGAIVAAGAGVVRTFTLLVESSRHEILIWLEDPGRFICHRYLELKGKIILCIIMLKWTFPHSYSIFSNLKSAGTLQLNNNLVLSNISGSID